MDDIVEKIKETNRIEDVIEESGFPLQRKRGKYLRGREHDSLVINTRNQTYTWNSEGEIQGDVIEWVMKRNGWDFKAAVEFLARRGRLPEPKWGKEDQVKREARRKRETAFGLAQSAMQKWLWVDKEALGYCRSRGWTDETIQEAGLGFSGRRSATAFQELRGDFSLHEIDAECPEAVAILGYKGDVRAWAKKWDVDIDEQPNWIEWKSVPGIMGQTRIVYAHYMNGRVVNFSSRNILGAEVNKEGREVKSYNLPVTLVGERQVYFNHVYGSRVEECVVVEGQADAVTLGQWRIAAVALIGTAYQDKELLLKELRERHQRLYLGMDADEAGLKAIRGRDNDWPMAFLMGPMARVVKWPESAGPEGQEGKDANDWLRWGMKAQGLTDYTGNMDESKLGFVNGFDQEKTRDEELLERAIDYAKSKGQLGIIDLQRGLKIGYPRAVRLCEAMEEMGMIEKSDLKGKWKTIEKELSDDCINEEEQHKNGEKVKTDPVVAVEEEIEDLSQLSDEELDRLEREGGLGSGDQGLATGDKGSEVDNEMIRAELHSASQDDKDEEDERGKWIKKLVEMQRGLAMDWIQKSLTFAEEAAIWAGELKGHERDKGYRTAFRIIDQMEKVERASYRQSLIAKMGIGIREFDGILKAAGQEVKEKPQEVIETLGGFIHNWLVEFIYNPGEDWGRLAYRDPEGKIGTAEFLDIEGIRYSPRRVNNFIKDGGVLFPSEIGPQKPTRELVSIVEMFLYQHYLLENQYLAKIIAYYVLLTWVYDCFNALPYLRALGEAGAGKSELMRRVGHLCYRMMSASGANTAASFFRATEMYRGTVFMDEADLYDGGDMSNDLVKFLNLGAMKGNPIWRLEEVLTEAGKNYEVATFQTFCPKLIAMRREFKDDAVGSRSLTIKLQPREPIELKARGIKLYIDEDFRQHSRAIRNLLLRWRFAVWQPEIEVTEEYMDLEVSSRLNQVTMPLKALAKDDPALQSEIVTFLRAYNQEMVLTKSMTLAARIVEAMWMIHQNPELREKYLVKTANGEGEMMLIGDVAKVANGIIDEMNAMEGEDQEDESTKKKRKRDSLTARGVGSLIRNELQLQVGERRGKGFPVYWDKIKLEALAKRYGVDPEGLKKEGAAETKKNDEAKQEKIPF